MKLRWQVRGIGSSDFNNIERDLASPDMKWMVFNDRTVAALASKVWGREGK